jgi:hypothetical protein
MVDLPWSIWAIMEKLRMFFWFTEKNLLHKRLVGGIAQNLMGFLGGRSDPPKGEGGKND